MRLAGVRMRSSMTWAPRFLLFGAQKAREGPSLPVAQSYRDLPFNGTLPQFCRPRVPQSGSRF